MIYALTDVKLFVLPNTFNRGDVVAEFCYRLYELESETILAICDVQVVGKVFTQEGLVLNAKKSFYCEEECGPIKAKRLFEQATIINATGEQAINLLVEQGLVDRERVLLVNGVPHAQMVRLP